MFEKIGFFLYYLRLFLIFLFTYLFYCFSLMEFMSRNKSQFNRYRLIMSVEHCSVFKILSADRRKSESFQQCEKLLHTYLQYPGSPIADVESPRTIHPSLVSIAKNDRIVELITAQRLDVRNLCQRNDTENPREFSICMRCVCVFNLRPIVACRGRRGIENGKSIGHVCMYVMYIYVFVCFVCMHVYIYTYICIFAFAPNDWQKRRASVLSHESRTIVEE